MIKKYIWYCGQGPREIHVYKEEVDGEELLCDGISYYSNSELYDTPDACINAHKEWLEAEFKWMTRELAMAYELIAERKKVMAEQGIYG